MPRKALNILKPLESRPLQSYFSNRYQLADIIEAVLAQIGNAHIYISTFSTSEEFLRRIWRLKNDGRVLSFSLFCDHRAARKTLSLYHFIKSLADNIYLCENHSKVVLLFNDAHLVSIVTSQNQTRGNRFECGVVSTDNHLFYQLKGGFNALQDKSLDIDVLLNSDN